jgi:hypothetical protein
VWTGCTANKIPETQGVMDRRRCGVKTRTHRVKAAVAAACNRVLNTWKPRAAPWPKRPPARTVLKRKERTAIGRKEPCEPLCSSGVPQKSRRKRSSSGVSGNTSSLERMARLKQSVIDVWIGCSAIH